MKKEKSPYYSIVIPVHNEEDSLIPLFAKVVETMESHDWDFEIVFVDDASTDGSPLCWSRSRRWTRECWWCNCAATSARAPRWLRASITLAAKSSFPWTETSSTTRRTCLASSKKFMRGT